MNMKITAVDQKYVEVQYFVDAEKDGYDACWDVYAGSSGKVYASCCGEGFKSLTARLYAYNAARKTLDFLFDVKDVTHPPGGTIPQSKIHTSMAEMEDGRIIMCTHTTAPADLHPIWAPYACYHDLYEGYSGSHIIVYDPETNAAEDMGIPVPRESTYGGGVYILQTHQYFMVGLMRGHLYAYDTRQKTTRDLGYVGTGFRLFKDPQGRVYGIASTGKGERGVMYRYDPCRDVLEDLDVELPGSPDAWFLGFAVHGPDGQIYFSRSYYDHIMVFDHERQVVRDLGIGFPDAERYALNQPPPRGDLKRFICGLCFLPDNRLYYGVMGGSLSEVVALMRWDILHGGTPEFLGFLYGDGRATSVVSEMVRGADGRLFIADTCFYARPPRLLIVDAVKMKSAGEHSKLIPRRWVDQNWLDQYKLKQQLTARSGNVHIDLPSDKIQKIEIYNALLPAWSCAVCGLGVDLAGRLHIGTQGGHIIIYDGKRAYIAFCHQNQILKFTVWRDFAYLADTRGIWRYRTDSAHRQPELIAEIPDGLSVDCLRSCCEKTVYGLLVPGYRPFIQDDKLWIGEETGTLIPGARTIIYGNARRFYGALDEGILYYIQDGNMIRTKLKLPALKGREFLSSWTAATVVGNLIYGGTNDGYMFKIDTASGELCNLGKPDLSLGIVDLAVIRDVIVGVSGRGDNDFCRLFSYSLRNGFQSLGTIGRMTITPASLSCITNLSDGRIAVGMKERISHVYILQDII